MNDFKIFVTMMTKTNLYKELKSYQTKDITLPTIKSKIKLHQYETN